jgi:hypothetical protein
LTPGGGTSRTNHRGGSSSLRVGLLGGWLCMAYPASASCADSRYLRRAAFPHPDSRGTGRRRVFPSPLSAQSDKIVSGDVRQWGRMSPTPDEPEPVPSTTNRSDRRNTSTHSQRMLRTIIARRVGACHGITGQVSQEAVIVSTTRVISRAASKAGSEGGLRSAGNSLTPSAISGTLVVG